MDCCLALPRRENTETGSSLSETVAFNARPLIYASGNFGKNILWGTTEITLLFVMTDMLELSPSLAGLILLGSLVVDGVLDPCVGFLADRLHTPIGRYGPLILIGAPLSALSFFALYTLPLVGAGSACLITFLVVVFRASYSLIDLPHNALMTHVTRQSEARGRLAGYRFLFSSLASFILALSLAPLIQNGGGEILSPRGLAVFAGSVACLSAIVMVASWSVVRNKDRESARIVRFRTPLMKGIRALWASPSYRIALVVGCLATFSLPLFGKSLLYIFHLSPGSAGGGLKHAYSHGPWTIRRFATLDFSVRAVGKEAGAATRARHDRSGICRALWEPVCVAVCDDWLLHCRRRWCQWRLYDHMGNGDGLRRGGEGPFRRQS